MSALEFLQRFKIYYDGINKRKSGASNSYVNSIRYLLEYLNVTELNEAVFTTLKNLFSELKNKNSTFYKKIQSYYTNRGRSSYVKGGFLRAALNQLLKYIESDLCIELCVKNDLFIDTVSENDIEAIFDMKKIRCELPICCVTDHIYDLRRENGTVIEAVKKIISGRKAEKYFISYLRDALGYIVNKDYFDVANNKEYGYDIKLLNIGMEIKNIKYGYFYLTDNEIARIENTNINLILVDIDNGIWLLKRNSKWLRNTLSNIKSIRKYCSENYCNLDLTDIKICLDEEVKNDIIDISKTSKEQLEIKLR